MTKQLDKLDTDIERLRAEVTRLRGELAREKRAHRRNVEAAWRAYDNMDLARVRHINILTKQLENERASIHGAWRTFFFLEKQGDDPRFISWH